MAERTHTKKSLVRFFSSTVLAIGISATAKDYFSPALPQPDSPNVSVITRSIDNQSKNEPSLSFNSTEQLSISWSENNKPITIIIPEIDFVSNIQQVPDELTDQNTTTYHTPDNGVATPQQPIPNNPYVFGHSRWHRVPREFAQIAKLEKNSQIQVLNDSGNLFIFSVVGFQIVDENQEKITSYPDLTLLLQTTAVQNSEWLLPKDEIMKKVENPRDKTDGNFALIIIAKPIASRKIADPNQVSLQRADSNYP